MSPRKRAKPNPQAETVIVSKEPSVANVPLPVEIEALTHRPRIEVNQSQEIEKQSCRLSVIDQDTSTPRRSWYGGTWSWVTKTSPIAQVAEEHIPVAGNAAATLVESLPAKSPLPQISRSIRSSSRSLPLAATTTKLNITSNKPSGFRDSAADVKTTPRSKARTSLSIASGSDKSKDEKKVGFDMASTSKEHNDPGPVSTDVDGPIEDRNFEPKQDPDTSAPGSSAWLGWFSKVAPSDMKSQQEIRGSTSSDQGIAPVNVPLEPTNVIEMGRNLNLKQQQQHIPAPDPQPSTRTSNGVTEPRSWLGFMSKGTSNPLKAALAPTTPSTRSISLSKSTHEDSVTPKPIDHDNGKASLPLSFPSRSSAQSEDTAKSTTWAFWSRDTSKLSGLDDEPEPEVGELALAGSSSQSRPEKVVLDEGTGISSTSIRLGKKGRPYSMELGHTKTASESSRSLTISDRLGKGAQLPGNIVPKDISGLKSVKASSNLVLPSFKLTYGPADTPTLLQQLGRLLKYIQPPPTKHVSLVQHPPEIKRALAIGIHGYFPAPLIRSVLGQPTGTSIRFANSAAKAIVHWTNHQGYSCKVEKVALEGEGKIAERVDLLWKLMLNWIDNIGKADFVMIACHSQGVPVAMMLVAKLIELGCVHATRIGVCAMAGVNLGPFADYKSRWISGSAGELFEFARPDSQVSKDYYAALETSLKFGVKIVFIGSIDDQLVSLESSTFSIISHPSIFRAVFVDGRVHAPDFLSHLVGFALKLRNLGVSDHGLIRELSSPLAGSLYGGEGHSRIYDDDAVYSLAVQYALETTQVLNMSVQIPREPMSTSPNPYILPFAMRGILEEDYVKTVLHDETQELLRQFDEWRPSSKVLKDVKFRLEGVRSKL